MSDELDLTRLDDTEEGLDELRRCLRLNHGDAVAVLYLDDVYGDSGPLQAVAPQADVAGLVVHMERSWYWPVEEELARVFPALRALWLSCNYAGTTAVYRDHFREAGQTLVPMTALNLGRLPATLEVCVVRAIQDGVLLAPHPALREVAVDGPLFLAPGAPAPALRRLLSRVEMERVSLAPGASSPSGVAPPAPPPDGRADLRTRLRGVPRVCTRRSAWLHSALRAKGGWPVWYFNGAGPAPADGSSDGASLFDV